jgi:hypothetical protein
VGGGDRNGVEIVRKYQVQGRTKDSARADRYEAKNEPDKHLHEQGQQLTGPEVDRE